jgi:hypothetical protein
MFRTKVVEKNETHFITQCKLPEVLVFETVNRGAKAPESLGCAYISKVVKCALGEVEVDVTVSDLKRAQKVTTV